jgi:mRNA-degrading endonuclease RelE of RelBE toxin-antitoxin system
MQRTGLRAAARAERSVASRTDVLTSCRARSGAGSVKGGYRILYEIEDQILRIMVVKIEHRRDVHRT